MKAFGRAMERSRWALAAGAFLVAAVGPATAQSPTSDEPVWTDRPVRIDRDNQDFERIGPAPESAPAQTEADRFTLHFTPRSPLTVVDSVTFQALGTRYRLAGLEPVPSERICRNDRGERWACGLRARASLSSLLKSEPVRCAPRGKVDDREIVECRRLGRDLGEAQVRDGHAIASAGGDYVDREAAARAASEGVWGDTTQEP